MRKRRGSVATRSLPLRESPKRETLRARRKRFRALALLAVAALFVLLGYGVGYASYLPRFSIDRIEVRGASDIRPKLVEVFVATKLWDGSPALLSESNILFFPRAEIEAALRDFSSRIASVNVSRESLLANALIVTVEERKPFARWCDSVKACFAMDSGGIVFAPASTTPTFETPYVFEGSLPEAGDPVGQAYLAGQLPAVLALLERLGQSSFSPERIVALGEQDYSVELREGFALRVSYGGDVGAIVKNLELVAGSEALRGKERELEYIDLRFGNRVYYKFKGGQENSL